MQKNAKIVFSLRSMRTGESFAVTGEMLIGRGTDCDMRLNVPLISRHHAKIYPNSDTSNSDTLMLEDLNSSNGTFLNSERITGCVPIKIGDKVSFDSLSFRITSPNATKNTQKTVPLPPNFGQANYRSILPNEKTHSAELDDLALIDQQLNQQMSTIDDELNEHKPNASQREESESATLKNDIDSLVSLVKKNLASELAEHEKLYPKKPLSKPQSEIPDSLASTRSQSSNTQANTHHQHDIADQKQANQAEKPALETSYQVPTPASKATPSAQNTFNNEGQSPLKSSSSTLSPKQKEPQEQKEAKALNAKEPEPHQKHNNLSPNASPLATSDSQPDFIDPKTKIRVRLKDKTAKSLDPQPTNTAHGASPSTVHVKPESPLNATVEPKTTPETTSPEITSPEITTPEATTPKIGITEHVAAKHTAPANITNADNSSFHADPTDVDPAALSVKLKYGNTEDHRAKPNSPNADKDYADHIEDRPLSTQDEPNKSFEEHYPFSEQRHNDEFIPSDDHDERVANLKFNWQSAAEKAPEAIEDKASNNAFLSQLHQSISEQDQSIDDNDIWLAHSNESEDSRTQFLKSTRTQSSQIVMMSAPTRGKIFSLDDDNSEWTIGRAPESAIYIPDTDMAHQHAKITLSSEGFVIETTQITNGMLINNRFANKVVLNNGDLIKFGKIEIVFQGPDEHEEEHESSATELADNKTFNYGSYAAALVILGAILYSVLSNTPVS